MNNEKSTPITIASACASFNSWSSQVLKLIEDKSKLEHGAPNGYVTIEEISKILRETTGTHEKVVSRVMSCHFSSLHEGSRWGSK